MPGPTKSLWTIPSLPFHIGTFSQPSNGPLPVALPFEVGLRIDLGLLVHIPSSGEDSLLQQAYAQGSQICTPLGETDLGSLYFNDYYTFAKEMVGNDFRGLDVLEVGFGRGFLLRALAQDGARLTGVDPTQAPSDLLVGLNAELYYCPFSPELFGERRFDVIMHTCVMEHLPDSLSFVQQMMTLLKPEGRIIFSVPDCSEHIAHGDLGMFVHEHLSYFDACSLERLALAGGAEVLACRTAENGGILLAAWRKSAPRRLHAAPFDELTFLKRARQGISHVSGLLAELAAAGQTLGVYCPGRFFNYHHIHNGPTPKIRYFDDNAAIHGAFFPPIDVLVESRQALVERPVDTLLIMSRSFGLRIAQGLSHDPSLANVRTVLVADLV